MKRIQIIAIIMLILAVPLTAQETLLTPEDMSRFITTFPEIVKDLETMNLLVEDTGTGKSLPMAITTSQQAEDIFIIRGWNENFMVKIQIILQGFYLSIAESEMLTVMPDIQEALNEIDATPVSPYFTIEMKQQTRDMVVMAAKSMNSALYAQIDSIAAEDMDLIRTNMEELKNILEVE